MATTHVLEWEGSQIEYLRFGEGPHLLFAFHGFADDARQFLVLEPVLREDYTVIALNLPFHGATRWVGGKTFTREVLHQLVGVLLHQEGKTSCSLLGYSLGGKMVFALIERLGKRVDAVLLLAPDGIRTHAAYNLSVYPRWGRALFRFTIDHPGWLFLLLSIGRFLRIIKEPVYRFTRNQMDTKEKRQRIQDVWLVIRDFKTNPLPAMMVIRQFQIPVLLVYGKYDAVIRESDGRRFATQVPTSRLVVLDKGHRLVKEYLQPVIRTFLRQHFSK